MEYNRTIKIEFPLNQFFCNYLEVVEYKAWKFIHIKYNVIYNVPHKYFPNPECIMHNLYYHWWRVHMANYMHIAKCTLTLFFIPVYKFNTWFKFSVNLNIEKQTIVFFWILNMRKIVKKTLLKCSVKLENWWEYIFSNFVHLFSTI